MKLSNQLNRSQKEALLSQLVEGNSAPIMHYKQEQEKPHAYVVNCYQVLPAERINSLDIRPDDRISGIEVTRTYLGDRDNETDVLPDMSRTKYQQWRDELEKSGSLVLGFIGTRYAPAG